jgi:SPP1 family predicted phage head-tail adaptor
MRAGTLKDRLTLQRFAANTDATWGTTPGWAGTDGFWADVEPLGGSERTDNAGVQTTISHRIRCRYRDDVTSKDRLLYRGRVLEIVSVIDADGARRELLIEAREHPMES